MTGWLKTDKMYCPYPPAADSYAYSMGDNYGESCYKKCLNDQQCMAFQYGVDHPAYKHQCILWTWDYKDMCLTVSEGRLNTWIFVKSFECNLKHFLNFQK